MGSEYGEKIRELRDAEGVVAALSDFPRRPDAGLLFVARINLGENFQGGHPEDHPIQLWDVATGRPLLTINGHTENVRSVVYSSDGRLLLSGGEDKTIRFMEDGDGNSRYRWDVGEKVNQVALSPDGRKIAAAR